MTLQPQDQKPSSLSEPLALRLERNGLQAGDLKGAAGSQLQSLNRLLEGSGGLENLRCAETRRRIQDAIDRGFITLVGNRVTLMPLASVPEGLRHLGRDTALSRNGMTLYKVYGDASSMAPTYLGTENWRGETNAWSDWDPTLTPDQKILLEIDSSMLLRCRSVYIDPESLEFDSGPAGYGDKMGQMFFVLGGIPQAAIRELRYPWGNGGKFKDLWAGVKVV